MRPHRAFIPVLAFALFAIVADAVPASAQGGLFGWFGGQRDDRYPQQQQQQRQNSWGGGGERRDSWFGRHERQLPPQTSAYSDPYAAPREQTNSAPSVSMGTGRYVAYCVRLCDGRHFPMQRHSNATSIQLCNAFCPAAKTQVFNGSQIDHAVAASGARYANLENAFVYREKIVPNCTCNGKDAFGLAKIDVASDPTLKPGDIYRPATTRRPRSSRQPKARDTVTANAALSRRRSRRDPEIEEKAARAASDSAARSDAHADRDRPNPSSEFCAVPHGVSCPTTSSAIDSAEVSPGDSIPNRLTRRGRP